LAKARRDIKEKDVDGYGVAWSRRSEQRWPQRAIATKPGGFTD